MASEINWLSGGAPSPTQTPKVDDVEHPAYPSALGNDGQSDPPVRGAHRGPAERPHAGRVDEPHTSELDINLGDTTRDDCVEHCGEFVTDFPIDVAFDADHRPPPHRCHVDRQIAHGLVVVRYRRRRNAMRTHERNVCPTPL